MKRPHSHASKRDVHFHLSKLAEAGSIQDLCWIMNVIFKNVTHVWRTTVNWITSLFVRIVRQIWSFALVLCHNSARFKRTKNTRAHILYPVQLLFATIIIILLLFLLLSSSSSPSPSPSSSSFFFLFLLLLSSSSSSSPPPPPPLLLLLLASTYMLAKTCLSHSRLAITGSGIF